MLHFPLIRSSIFLEKVVCVGLCWRFRVWVVKKILNTKQDLFDRDRGFPALFFIQDRQADGTRWIDVWVEQGRSEFACSRQSYAM